MDDWIKIGVSTSAEEGTGSGKTIKLEKHRICWCKPTITDTVPRNSYNKIVGFMSVAYFVDKHSVVREIWGKSDTILFIFAGASAEFALNKAVDWLYFTGRLPADPLSRLFSTVSYARTIVFAEEQSAMRAIDAIAAIHARVEAKRGANIPDWAYRDVLFMLIDYSIRSFEVLERKLTSAEKQEVFDVFYSVGSRMGVKGLPEVFDKWEKMREGHLYQDLQYSCFTNDLFSQYRKHLGPVRYRMLMEVQNLVVPQKVRELLGFRRTSLLNPLIRPYKFSRSLKLDWLLKALILPSKYKNEIKALDSVPAKQEPSFRQGRARSFTRALPADAQRPLCKTEACRADPTQCCPRRH